MRYEKVRLMKIMPKLLPVCLCVPLLLAPLIVRAAGPMAPGEIATAIKTVKSLGSEGKNLPAASAAALRLAAVPPGELPRLLAGFAGAGPVAANLLTGAVESAADRAAADNTPLPVAPLETFVRDTAQDVRARRLAYQMLVKADATAADRLLPGMLSDPSADFRRDAVARRIDAAKATADQAAAQSLWQQALSGAVDDDQVKTIVAALKKDGVEVDVPRHFGFLTTWQGIGPFDNRGGGGFAAVYPPEETVDLAATYPGQLGEVTWRPVTAEDDYGLVSIGKEWGNNKGSGMYFATEYDAAAARDVELRLQVPNAWKLWLNGELLFEREEYHRGGSFDQYRVPGHLQAGRNIILLKVLQNEQTEEWAQRYEFSLRVTDSAGAAVLPRDAK